MNTSLLLDGYIFTIKEHIWSPIIHYFTPVLFFYRLTVHSDTSTFGSEVRVNTTENEVYYFRGL
jgi:hypothetical protein